MQVRERQVRERQRDGGVAPAPPAGQGITKRGRSRPTKAAAISAAILGVLLLVTLSVMNGGVSSRRDARPASAAVVETSDFTIPEPSRLQRAVTWIDGLAAGLILPHEVTSRLAVQNPTLAKVVEAAWADLRSAPASELRRAVRWIDGLAAGLILTHEITSRLAVQDPDLARLVQAAWSDLAPVAGRVPAG
jgi:hypothetical protein